MEKESENYEYYNQFSGARVLLDIFRLILSLIIEFNLKVCSIIATTTTKSACLFYGILNVLLEEKIIRC